MIRTTLLRLAVPVALAGTLAGCLQPVHAPGLLGGSKITPLLAEVSVAEVDGYLGYILKSELDFLLTGGAEPRMSGRYLLKVKTQQSKATSIIDASTGRAQIATLQIEAVYVLLDQKESGKIKASGKTFASASFDRSQLRFATVRAERDAEKKVARSLAERLRIIVTTALAKDTTTGPEKTPELTAPDLDSPSTDQPGDEN
jgi:LPS-assembly lipoprotein